MEHGVISVLTEALILGLSHQLRLGGVTLLGGAVVDEHFPERDTLGGRLGVVMDIGDDALLTILVLLLGLGPLLLEFFPKVSFLIIS